MRNTFPAALAACGFALAAGVAGAVDLQKLADEAALARITNEIDIAVDRKQWDRARGFLADTIRVDFTSLVGGQPATIAADDLIAGWRGNLGARKTSLHLRTNHLVSVEGDRATVYSHGYAWNRLEGNGEPLWEVWGNYTHEMQRTPAGWKVTSFTFVMTHERGNPWVRSTPAP